MPPLSVTFWKNESISAIAGAYELVVNAGYLVASCVVLFEPVRPVLDRQVVLAEGRGHRRRLRALQQPLRLREDLRLGRQLVLSAAVFSVSSGMEFQNRNESRVATS